MTKFGLVIILILLAGRNYAQQNYFILIQADDKQTFYVRQGGRAMSSSAEGALILSQLKDSTYNIVVGFPGQQSPDQAFSIDLHHKDQQFILRNQADKGWVLYNPMTGETRIADLKEGKGAELQIQGVKKDDAFSRLMAGVVRDTAVMYNTYAADPSSLSRDSLASGGLDTSRAFVAGKTIIDSSASGIPARSRPDSSIARVGSHPDTTVVNSPAGSSGLGTVADPGRTTAPPVVDPAVAQTDKGANQSGKPAGQADSSQTAPGGAAMPPIPSKPDSGSLVLHSGSRVNAGNSLVPDSAAAGVDSTARRPLRRSNIIKLSERKLPHSLRLAFSDRSSGKKADTVIMFIMKDTPALSNPRIGNGLAATGGAGSPVPPPSGKALHPSDTGHRASPRTNGPNPDGSVAVSGNIAGEAGKVKPDTAQKRPPAKMPLPFVNSDCHDFATDYDVDKLRVKMLEATKDEDRIQAARKVFKAKCFNTRQIKALSEVFATDAFKFRFYETAYPFASDDHFRELAGTLADPVYNSKFKAMTGQQ